MNATVPFERRSFGDIIEAIRRIFPIEGGPEFVLTPDSICHYLTLGGVDRVWQRIPGWESYEWGTHDISEGEFVTLLFSPRRPASDETILAVTDECFVGGGQRGFALRFGDLLPFASEVYPNLFARPVAFFQPFDMIFVAEESKLLIMLQHEGWQAQYAV